MLTKLIICFILSIAAERHNTEISRIIPDLLLNTHAPISQHVIVMNHRPVRAQVIYYNRSAPERSCRDQDQGQTKLCFNHLEDSAPGQTTDCIRDEECVMANSICYQNSCQCRPGFYFDDACYQYAQGLNGACKSDEGCKRLPNTTCSDGQCVCLPSFDGSSGTCLETCTSCTQDVDTNVTQCPENYYSENNYCYQIPKGYEVSVETAKACEYLEGAYYFRGKCYPPWKNLHQFCDSNDQCEVPFSECSSGTCQCKEDYLEHDQKCYGRPNAECNSPQDCPTMWLSCSAGTCQNSFVRINGEVVSSKPGATVKFVDSPNISQKRISYNYTNLQGRVMPMTGSTSWEYGHSLEWVALPLDVDESLVIIWCRKKIGGKFWIGKITIPGDGLCRIDVDGKIVSTENYALLKDQRREWSKY